jgi:signal peptidase I
VRPGFPERTDRIIAVQLPVLDDEAADPAGPAADYAADQAATEVSQPRRRKPKRSRRRAVIELVSLLAGALVLTILLRAFVVQVYLIPSASMENTLMVGDRVLVNKMIYHFRGIHRGDVIVFSGAGSWGDLDGQPADYIKRVIGLPGDHVACCTDGNITVNGVQLDESSFIIPATDDPGAAGPASQYTFSITVPPGRLWVMGDNRADSDDSMLHYTQEGYSLIASTIPENEVIGEAVFIAWPFSQFGTLPSVHLP